MRAAKVLKVNDDNVIKDDVLEGMTGIVTVRLAEPQFEGQTKEILGTPASSDVVARSSPPR
jgi:DNA gyrase subunit B